MKPIKTVSELIEQLSQFPGDARVGVGDPKRTARIQNIHFEKMFTHESGPNGEYTTALCDCVVLEPVELPALPSEEEIKATMAKCTVKD